jgi:rod shape determining protein RodA
MKALWLRITNINWLVILVVTCIATIGFAILYSAADGSIHPWASRQFMRFLSGLAILIVFASIDIRVWLSYSYTLYALSLLLLVVVEIMGSIGMGAQRWVDLYLFTLQPSEIMKITLIMAVARYFHNLRPDEPPTLLALIPPALMVVIPAILVLRQPNLGTMMILVFSGFSVFFVAGMRLWVLITVGLSALVSIPIFWNLLHDYQRSRILTFLDPERDPLGTSYNIIQSKIALGSGGFFGKGWRQGSQSHLSFLPEKHTDFIFSMYSEEFGFFGGLILLILYSLLIFYGYHVSLKSRSPYGRFLGIGLTTLFFLYVFINIAMEIGLLPAVGLPLPLVSYGGTSMITIMMSLGLLMSIEIHRYVRISRTGK